VSQPRVLMVYLEPAPYIVGLIEAVRAIWPGPIDVIFRTVHGSQNWNVSVDDIGATILPVGTGAALAEVARRLRRGHYGLVHLAGWGHPVLLAALLCAASKKIPIVVESDTQLLPASQLMKLKSHLSLASLLSVTCRAVVRKILYPFLFKLPDQFLPAGTRQIAYLTKYGVNPRRIRMAKMTVDVKYIMTFCAGFSTTMRRNLLEKYEISQDQVRFLFVGRLEPYKGVVDLLNGFRILSQQQTDVCLIVVGDGSLAQDVSAAATQLTSLHYLGRLDGKRLWEVYATADALVLPSHRESWGLVVNEAMAAGLPVIVSESVGCINELVQQGATGLIIPAGSPEALCAAMREMARDAARRARMGAEARRLIADWTPADQAQITVESWAEALS
jgi:glycosyltransferase involved in cell wall biosynthesis